LTSYLAFGNQISHTKFPPSVKGGLQTGIGVATIPFGIEGFTVDDRAYSGSRFADVRTALFSNSYQKTWGAAGAPPLPINQVTLANILRGLLPLGRPLVFRTAAERILDSSADLRWGPNRKGYYRLLHPNGICLTGLWHITEETTYSGYFRQGSRALIVARYSTCCSETRRGGIRSLSLVGKLFPTIDRNHVEPLRTANFITQQDIGGDRTDFINDAELRNAPDTTAWRRGLGIPILTITGIVFKLVDNKPTIRQLYQIAELGKEKDEPTRSPTYMRLLVASEQPRIGGEHLDFRDEIMAQIYGPGDPAPKRALRFIVSVTDEGETQGSVLFERRVFKNWQPIGTIEFNEAVVSYNGDFVIHFPHPTWREDQNDPTSATRVNGRKMR
jgi:hypothetical protein